jgi:hypothetical protein
MEFIFWSVVVGLCISILVRNAANDFWQAHRRYEKRKTDVNDKLFSR